MRNQRKAWRRGLIAAAMAALQGVSCAQESAPPEEKPAEEPREKITAKSLVAETGKAFERGDYARAEELLRKHLLLEPGNFVVHYNMACARALQGDGKGAGEWLVKAVEHGFTDLKYMQSDPMLEGARADENYRKLVDNWGTILEARRAADVRKIEETYNTGYNTTADERLRLTYRSAFNQAAFEGARAELTRIAAWADREVMPGIIVREDGGLDPWVTVILPTREDFAGWVVKRYGPDALEGLSTIGGAYVHDSKQLIAMDLGGTLRHEFFHVLHWRSMSRLGQQHPVWIMEGLCSLIEDYDLNAQGEIVPAPSWRTNTVKRLEKIGRLMKLEQLTSMPQSKFTSNRPLANYAQARAVFLFMQQRGKLKEWYAHYTGHFDEDPTGLASLESVMGVTAKELDREFREWVRALPEVPEEIKPGMASLGMEVDSGEGEGVVITRLSRPRAQAGELRVGDVVTAIDAKPVRDIAELVRILGTCSPGDEVTISYRRGKKVGETKLTLVAKARNPK